MTGGAHADGHGPRRGPDCQLVGKVEPHRQHLDEGTGQPHGGRSGLRCPGGRGEDSDLGPWDGDDGMGGSEGEEALGGDRDGEAVAVEVHLDLVQYPRTDRGAPTQVFAAEQIDAGSQRVTPAAHRTAPGVRPGYRPVTIM